MLRVIFYSRSYISADRIYSRFILSCTVLVYPTIAPKMAHFSGATVPLTKYVLSNLPRSATAPSLASLCMKSFCSKVNFNEGKTSHLCC